MHTRSSFLFSSQAPCSRPLWSPGGHITSLTVVRALDISLAAPAVEMAVPEDFGAADQSSAIAPATSRIALAAAMVLLGVSGADAGDILRGGTPLGGRPGGGKGTAGPVNAAAEAARINAKDALARTTQAIASVRAMQDAARAAALKAPNNLGTNPNFAGTTLPNVADGLAAGGLKVAAGVPRKLSSPKTGEDPKLWRGAALPTQSSRDGRVNVTVFQTASQAVLNWETFNVGKKTTLTFNQDRGGADKTQWTAFNKVADPSGAPSQILGKIEAPGQVYVINPNGIMFGGSSQINLHGLVASSLPINEGLITRGLLSNPDSQFLFSALPQAAGKNGTPAHTPVASLAPGGKYGDVVVQKGAQISAPSSSNVGGRVMLVGPNVKNEGTISTPDGQTVLAAGLQVGITAHPSSDARLRGLDVWVGAVNVPAPATPETPPLIPAQNPAGTATNNGLIEAARGNTTIAGRTVNQLGVIDSSTSVSVNGSINLLANFGATIIAPVNGDAFFSHTSTGTLTMGDGSVQQILPELFNEKTVIGLELPLRSRVTVQGRNILMGKDSTLLAPNADVTLAAGQWLTVGTSRQFFSSTGQIYLDTGALLNVAGTTDVVVPISQNILSLELRGAELADSPLQRRGPLRGPTLNLDIRQRGTYNGLDWVGTPLGNAVGYVGLIERNVGELTTAGGTVSMNAGNSVVIQKGAKVDVSGGYVNFEGGTVATTRIISDGRIVDIANALPDRVHTSLYDASFTVTSPKYGVQRTFEHPLALSGEHFEPGYIEGKNAGSVNITAPAMVLDGELVGKTISGPRQRTAALAPKLGALALTVEKPDADIINYRAFSPTPPAITFGAGALPEAGAFSVNAAGDATPLDPARLAKVILPQDIFTNFGSVTINNGDGSVEVPEETKLKLQPRGSFSITAANIDIRSDITAPNGSLSFTALKITPYLDHRLNDNQRAFLISDFDVTRGRFSLERGVRLDVAGLVVDDRPLSSEPLAMPIATDGGSVAIAGFKVDLEQGSVIDASGGVVFDRSGRRTYGAGGSISIRGGNDPRLTYFLNGYVIRERVTDPDPNDEIVPPDRTFTVSGARLNLGAQLRAFSGARGGSLTIQAPSIQIGGAAPASETTVALTPEFFSQGGFTSFSLTGLGEPAKDGFVAGVTVVPGAVIKPIAKNILAVPYGPSRQGAEMMEILQPQALRTPVSITLRAPGVREASTLVTRGDVVIGRGVLIETDPRGSITIAGETVDLLGSLVAPAGTISVSGSSNLGIAYNESAKSLTSFHIGPDAVLSAKGTTLYTPNPFGFRTGSVLAGGRISVSGNIVAESGAVLDVSGASGIFDLAPSVVDAGPEVTLTSVVPVTSGINAPLYTRTLVPTKLDSDAGEIVLAGGQHLFSDATLLGNAGGSSALGGTLTVSSGRFYEPGIISNPTDITLKVTQAGPTIPLGGNTNIGKAVSTASGVGHFAADTFARGGFDALTLRGTVEFVGPVNIDARRTLTVADNGVLYANGAVTLKAPYVTLGTPFKAPLTEGQVDVPYLDGNGQPYKFNPTNGTGTLTVIGNLIDIGNLALRNIGRASFVADNGDVRGNGTLNVAGDIHFRAGQIYTPTSSTFTIAAADYKVGEETFHGSVAIEGSGNRQIPLSAGGTLNVYASNIVQGGALRVPLGSINIGWNGDGTAPVNPVTGEAYAKAENITLAPGSITSVSAISPLEGAPLLIPFGINVNGVTWIDPSGRDITAGGVAQKSVNISGLTVNSQTGSLIDIRGGGDLFSYRWVQGNGGSRDILASTTTFAVIPGYSNHYAPYSPFSTGDATAGFVNTTLRVGDCVYLGGTSTLAEGNYTLLPARYALMPGAHLVTLKSGTPIGTLALPDGSTLVPGYRFNDLNSQRTLNPQYSWFEVLSPDVVGSRAEYAGYLGNEFLFSGAAAVEARIPRLASDAGQLTLQAVNSMNLSGHVAAGAPGRSRGGIVDIASPVDIIITGAGAPKTAGKLTLDAGQLSSFGAESLLIGGIRKVNGDGTANITVKTNNLTVDNAGTALRGPEIILVANRALTLADGAIVQQQGTMRSPADRLILGTAGTAGSGDGTLLRVTSDSNAQIVRNGLGNSTAPNMVVGAGATISGVNVTLDSTFGTSLDPQAIINAGVVSLNSGQISIQLDNPGTLNATSGLVLGGAALRSLEKSGSVSLLSYTTLDLYGTGDFNVAGKLALHAGAIRGFNNDGGTTTISAGSLSLDNSANAAIPAAGAMSGTLELRAGIVSIGKGNLAIQHFSDVVITASGGVSARNTGSLSAQGDLTIRTPVVTAAQSATQSIKAAGALILEDAGAAKISGGLGASLALEGASVTASSDIVLPSGLLTVRATTGDVNLDGRVNLNGTEQTFYDLTRYTSGGTARFFADNGNIIVGADSVISVSAPAEGGNAGSLVIGAPKGSFTNSGQFVGRAGRDGKAGSFSFDAAGLSDFDALETTLVDGGFTGAQNFRIRSGNVALSGTAKATSFALSADTGSITVTGTIDTSGVRGGNIALAAGGSVILSNGAALTVEGKQFDAAGKGGRIALETRGLGGGVVDIQTGATINLGVDANTATSAEAGNFTGTLHLRAPQNAGSTDLAVATIGGTINNASAIIVEGYKTFDLGPSGLISTTVQNNVLANGNAFVGTNGTAAAGYNAMLARVLGTNTALDPVLSIRAGAELFNATGNITLGMTTSTATSDWNLAAFRFGPDAAPGVLTLRAAGNVVLFNTISDGFQTSAYNSALLAQSATQPLNAQSWSYRITAGADLTAADYARVMPMTSLTADSGSLLLGKNGGNGVFGTPGATALTATAVGNRYQAIRTGSGDIAINAARDVQLLNQFAVIFTAGTQVADATMAGKFDLPVLNAAGSGDLGSTQQSPAAPVQYTLGGGNVTINAGNDIAHYTRIGTGPLIADSSRQMPTNWLYRRGFIDPVTGEFGNGRFGDNATTTWWVDFANFFEGVGALGGGNVTLDAGRNISNVDAVTPTNARMAKGAPNAANLVELGGGDVTVRAGNDIDGGVYYVERGRGVLSAGGSIKTNNTRSPSLTILKSPADYLPEQTWLPTTLFLGKANFDVSARGDLLLGPAANPFLLPGGFNNTYWYKTYFSTYGAESGVSATSLSGDVTLRLAATDSSVNNATPLLLTWYKNELLLSGSASASFYQPWLRLNETSVTPFAGAAALMPGSLNTTAFSGDINIVGNLTLSPSGKGELTLAASGSVNGLNITGFKPVNSVATAAWGASRINLSDANPDAIPGVISPNAYQTTVGTIQGQARVTGANIFTSFDTLFAESGSTRSVLQTKQALHSPGVLHAGDETPLRIYAGEGDIQGITLFSPKAAQIFAGRDIADVALYIQNTSDNDVSIVSAGRDIIPYSANTQTRVLANSAGNVVNPDSVPLAGDVQVSGPGALEVLAGRNIDLGTGRPPGDGTGLGIVSIGNSRNPYLPFDGADLFVGAGLGPSGGLGASALDFATFAEDVFANPRYADAIAARLGTAGDIDSLSDEQRNLIAMELFYYTLRDSGRDRNDPASANFGTYAGGFEAIEKLFPGTAWKGDISLTARQIKTAQGGDVSIFTPGGKIIVGFDAGAGQSLDQGILTESGGNIHIFADGSVTLGTSRIFTLRGGNEIIWSSNGDIAAGTSSKTVASAPPTRVLIDPQSADLKTDLAGLATGGGIGVLTTVEGIPPGDVDLIAPNGAIDAGDAGIRSAGNLNVAADVVLNAENIQVSGSSAGAPGGAAPTPPSIPAAPPPPQPADNNQGSQAAAPEKEREKEKKKAEEPPSIIVVEVLGYGG